jgi:hypothetical protein
VREKKEKKERRSRREREGGRATDGRTTGHAPEA